MRTALALVALVTLAGCSDPAYSDGPGVTGVEQSTTGTTTTYDDGLVVTTTPDGQRTAYHPLVGVITEDSAHWDCSRMGNLLCGPDAPEPLPLSWHDADRIARRIVEVFTHDVR